jgi:hypothetical protein
VVGLKFQPLTLGKSFGYLRFFLGPAAQYDLSSIEPTDIVVCEETPIGRKTFFFFVNFCFGFSFGFGFGFGFDSGFGSGFCLILFDPSGLLFPLIWQIYLPLPA